MPMPGAVEPMPLPSLESRRSVPLEAQDKDPRPVTAPITSLWKRLGFRIGELPRTVAVTPVEGLERLDRGAVAAVLKRTVEAARYLDEFAAEEAS